MSRGCALSRAFARSGQTRRVGSQVKANTLADRVARACSGSHRFASADLAPAKTSRKTRVAAPPWSTLTRDARPNRRMPCPHGRQRSLCKECGGSGFCEHGRQRSRCKECGGSSICEHGRVRCSCKECSGSVFCEHGRRRSECKACGGASICEHGRLRRFCKECGGSGICEHGRQRHRCGDCRGGDHVTILDATEVEDSDWEEEGEEEELLPTVQARGAAGPRGGKRKR